jgi:DNA primase
MKGRTPDEVRRLVSMRDVLDALGIEYRVNGDELVARCRSGEHEDKNPSWSMHDEPGEESNGLFHCFSCGWGGDVFRLVEKVKDCRFVEAFDLVAEFLCTPVPVDRVSGNYAEVDYRRIFRSYRPTPVRLPPGVRKVLDGSECMRYLLGRGIGTAEIERFGLLDWAWRRRVMVPITREGVLVTWTARSYAGEKPKALHPETEEKHTGARWGIFGLDQVAKDYGEVSITEGWASAIRVYQAGFANPVAVCGSKMTEEQAGELRRVARFVTIWQEGDAGGRTLVKSVVAWLGRGTNIEIVRLEKNKDPADCTPEELLNMYENRRRL